MCGVSAIVKFRGRVVREDLARMSSAIAHRGPDESGFAMMSEGRAGLAHVRLSIVDVVSGQQPAFNEDHTIAISFNGEIYDHAALRKDLLASGHRFRSTSDTEVIVHLYEEYGLEFVDHLNGEFAFVLWDSRQRRLVAGRDRSGIKPLFYRVTADEIILCSEAKGILALERVERRIAPNYVTGPFLGVFPSAHCAFENIASLKPGHLLIVDASRASREQPYWSHDYTPDRTMTWDDAKEGVRARFDRAVERRMVADVEVAAYLSGGLDSTLICASMAKRGARFKTFNVGFVGTPYDESSLAGRIAGHYGAEFETFDCSVETMADEVERTLYHTEQAIADPHSIAKQLLSKLVRSRGHKVCITGEGADEVFAGYPHFKLDAIKRMLRSGGEVAARARPLWERFKAIEARTEGHLWTRAYVDRPPDPRDGVFSEQYFFVRSREIERTVPWLLTPGMLGGAFAGNTARRFEADLDVAAIARLEPLNLGRRIALNQLYSYIIPVLGDRVEMANSVECRTPFLDRDLLEFTDRIPPEWLIKLDELREKYVLREAFAHDLPAFLQTTRKHPFVSSGWDALLRTRRGDELLREHLSWRRLKRAGIFRPATVLAMDRLTGGMRQKARRAARQNIGMILSLQLLHDRFVERAVPSDPAFRMTDRTPAGEPRPDWSPSDQAAVPTS
jgi:asparagine synthase (glutamine-hydrolysing)